MPDFTYVNDLNDKFIIVGSVGRKTHHNKLMDIFSKYSDTITKILEKDYREPTTTHDLDLLTVDNIYKLAEKYEDILISPKTLTRQSDILTLKKRDSNLPKVKKYNIFVASTKEELPFYFFYSLLGQTINIIMRLKMRAKGLKLSRHGIYHNDKFIKLPFKNDLFYDLETIVKFIYKYGESS